MSALASSAYPRYGQECRTAGADCFSDESTEFERGAELVAERASARRPA